jgi:glycosyltransferase involved in cell wall biosynthesis
MKHSVILANYNGSKYLNEAIQSVLMQRDAEFELILVDDSSTDSSMEIMRGFKLSHSDKIQILAHDRNRGQGAGFNSGFSLVSGELVSFIDSDDIWYPNKLHAVEQLHSLNPDAVLLHHNLHIIHENEFTQQMIMDMMAMGDLSERIKKTKTPIQHWPRFAPTSGLTFPSRVLSRMWPCPEVRFCADMYPTFAVAATGPIVADYRALGAYRVHAENHFYAKANFDLWEFFYKEIVPSLRSYFSEANLVDIIEMKNISSNNQVTRPGIIDKIADISPRVMWRQLRKFVR